MGWGCTFIQRSTIRRKSVEAQSTASVITIGATDRTAALHHFFASTDAKLDSYLQTTQHVSVELSEAGLEAVGERRNWEREQKAYTYVPMG